jgi:hypothetical protein
VWISGVVFEFVEIREEVASIADGQSAKIFEVSCGKGPELRLSQQLLLLLGSNSIASLVPTS